VRICLDADEYWPWLTIDEGASDQDRADFGIDVPPWTVQRWREALSAAEKVQAEMRQAKGNL